MSLLSIGEVRSDSNDVAIDNSDRHTESQPSLFRIEPDFQKTPLISSRATANSAFFSATFNSFNLPLLTRLWFARLRKHHLYNWFLVGFAIVLVVTELAFSFQTAYWWFTLYLAPFMFFVACELTGADRSTLALRRLYEAPHFLHLFFPCQFSMQKYFGLCARRLRLG